MTTVKPGTEIRFYRAQERFGCVVKDWPSVWRMPRKFPNGRLVAVSLATVVNELRSVGYTIQEPDPPAAQEKAHERK